VEIKNMNSFRNVERAIDHEISRQEAVLREGGSLVQETRLWDPDREVTRSMRSKESAHDYRYFPEPDLLPLVVSNEWIAEVRAALPELPDARRRRLVTVYGLPEYDAEVLTARKDVAQYFDAAVKAHANAKAISNWIMGDVLRVIKERNLDAALTITEWPVAPERLAEMVKLVDEGSISGKIAKTVFEEMVRTGKAAGEIIAAQGLTQISDDSAIDAAVNAVLAENAAKVAEYRSGKEKLFGFFVGQVMKATQGKVNPQKLNEILKKKLQA
ncbi:MAG TPA: hypothetical protein VMT89_10670, partial [Candidatus Acidoferrales bacterium]|nr:hypothetical protein [Candidatus Acidoferrales bacterium]